MSRDDAALREADQREANDRRARMIKDLGTAVEAVVEAHHCLDDHGPTYARYLAITALTDALGQQLAQVLIDDPVRARPCVPEVFDRLNLFVGTAGQRPN